jgi:hypothetical protein
MAGEPNIQGPSFPVLRFMLSLKAARDFGLDAATVDRIALRFDPRKGDVDRLADALASALIEQSALEIPESV